MPWKYGVRIRRPKPEASQSPRSTTSRMLSAVTPTTSIHSSRRARQRPGITGARAAATISQSGSVAHSAKARPIIAGASTHRRSTHITTSPDTGQVLLGRLVAGVDAVAHLGEVAVGQQRVVADRRAAGGEDVHLNAVGDLGELACEAVTPGDLEGDAGDLPGPGRHLQRPVDAAHLEHEHALGP